MTQLPENITWDERFFTGIEEIDEQHKRLVHLVNLLGSNLSNQPDISYLNYIFTELIDYSTYHFQAEEEIWHRFLAEDPLEAEHEKEHSNFVSVILRLEKEENSKPLIEVLESIFLFLTEWLVHHILESDMRLARLVLAIQSGLPLEQAKLQANQSMNNLKVIDL